MNSRVIRRTKNQLLNGVCSGLSDFYGIDVIFLRILWVISISGYGFGLILYVLLTIFLPDDSHYPNRTL